MNGNPFKLGTFATSGGGAFAAIILDDDAIPLTAAAIACKNALASVTTMLASVTTIQGLLEVWDANFAALQELVAFLEKERRPGAQKLASLRALPPVARPGKMFYAAQNFQEHVDEMLRAGMTPASGPKFTGEKSTSDPYLFLKAPSTLCGANDDIAIPLGLKKIDWEAEIALAIGKPGKHIKAERALDHVAGYTCFVDGSVRDYQKFSVTSGKNFPGTGPLGPWLVTTDEIADPSRLTLTTRLNGAQVQHATTDQLIYSIPQIIAFCSDFTALSPGDVIATGTPEGVGHSRKPPLWMKPRRCARSRDQQHWRVAHADCR